MWPAHRRRRTRMMKRGTRYETCPAHWTRITCGAGPGMRRSPLSDYPEGNPHVNPGRSVNQSAREFKRVGHGRREQPPRLLSDSEMSASKQRSRGGGEPGRKPNDRRKSATVVKARREQRRPNNRLKRTLNAMSIVQERRGHMGNPGQRCLADVLVDGVESCDVGP